MSGSTSYTPYISEISIKKRLGKKIEALVADNLADIELARADEDHLAAVARSWSSPRDLWVWEGCAEKPEVWEGCAEKNQGNI